jgi:hypothetical protein
VGNGELGAVYLHDTAIRFMQGWPRIRLTILRRRRLDAFQISVGVQQELPGRDDALSWLKALQHRNFPSALLAQHDFHRPEATTVFSQHQQVSLAGADDRLGTQRLCSEDSPGWRAT